MAITKYPCGAVYRISDNAVAKIPVNRDLAEEIETKRQEIANNFNHYAERQNVLIKKSLQDMGDTYNFWARNPGLREACQLANREIKTLKKMTRDNTQAMFNAWHYLSTHSTSEQFYQNITPQMLKSVNALMNRFDITLGNFRNGEVTMNIPGYIPPMHEEVPRKIEEIIENINAAGKTNPLETAIYTHLSLTLTQPFDSSNKRTARIIQNKLLTSSYLPPLTIAPAESKEYLEIIRAVAPAYAQKDLEGQRPFYDFMAKKVNLELDKMKGGIN